MTTSLPAFFLSHGGGPWPYLDGPFRRMFSQLEQSLKDIRRALGDAPKAALVISGHWIADGFALSSGAVPGMVYDYAGFPPHTYQIRFKDPGSLELATRVRDLLEAGGIPGRLEPARGYDHGTFSMMQPLYPDEDLPIVQLSIDRRYDPALHLRLWALLAPLRDEDVLIIGSGLSYHNLMGTRDPSGGPASAAFDVWLQETLVSGQAEDCAKRLMGWKTAPMARAAHSEEDHLIPLMAVVGAAEGDPGRAVHHQKDLVGHVTASSFRFG